jgi:hypothetical protein
MAERVPRGTNGTWALRMATRLLPGERTIREGAANLQRGAENVGGALLLTDRRLVFRPHGLNLRTEPEHVPLASVREVRACWTRFLGVVPIADNSVVVRTWDGAEHRFVVFDRGLWIEAIRAHAGEAVA